MPIAHPALFSYGWAAPLLIINCLRRYFAHPLGTGRSAWMQASEKIATWHENHILRILVIKSLTLERQALETCLNFRRPWQSWLLVAMVRNEYHSECFCRASHYHARCPLVRFAMQTPSMSSWVFTCPHRLQPSQGHATSRGKSMALHIGWQDGAIGIVGSFVPR